MKRQAKIDGGVKLEFVTKMDTSKQDGNKPVTIKVYDLGFYLSKKAVEDFGIQPDMFFHLANTKDANGKVKAWYFVCNDDPEDGHRINPANHGACQVLSRPLSRLFRTEAGKKNKDVFHLQDTGSELDGFKVIEILTHKTTQELKDQIA